jgi:signal transduction histidine kinase
MFRVYACITEQHDLRLVVLAGAICMLACFATIDLSWRVRHAGVRTRAIWLTVAAIVAGTGVWATHFIAMLAFQTGFPVAYDMGLTALSVVVAILIAGVGLFIATRYGRTLIGGAIVGAGVGAMHYTGMTALIAPAAKVWDPTYVHVSVLIGVVGGALALFVGLRRDVLKDRLTGANLLALAICGLHFTGMAGLTLYPEPTFGYVNVEYSTNSLVVGVVAATLLIVTLGFTGSIVDRHLMERTKQESERLRAYITELETTKNQLETRTEEVRTALNEAAAGSQAKSQFLAAMSHELRTPLNAIIGFSEVQVSQMFGPIGDARYLEYARDIHRSGSHLLALINDVLDFSKLDAYGLDIQEEPVDLGEHLAEAVHLMRGQSETSQVALRLEADDGMPILYADPRRLRQIVLNLLSNALKFTPKGGEVVVAATWTSTGYEVAVRDTGIGIEPTDIASALEPFRQVDNSLSRSFEGTGLGLPLAKRLVERHEGTLSLESAPGVGTTVTVWLPAARAIRDANRDAKTG